MTSKLEGPLSMLQRRRDDCKKSRDAITVPSNIPINWCPIHDDEEDAKLMIQIKHIHDILRLEDDPSLEYADRPESGEVPGWCYSNPKHELETDGSWTWLSSLFVRFCKYPLDN